MMEQISSYAVGSTIHIEHARDWNQIHQQFETIAICGVKRCIIIFMCT